SSRRVPRHIPLWSPTDQELKRAVQQSDLDPVVVESLVGELLPCDHLHPRAEVAWQMISGCQEPPAHGAVIADPVNALVVTEMAPVAIRFHPARVAGFLRTPSPTGQHQKRNYRYRLHTCFSSFQISS